MEKKKVLYLENVASIDAVNFYKTAAMAAMECGLEFHLAYNASDRSEEKIETLRKEMGVYFHQIDFVRNPFHPGNIKAYRQVCDLIQKLKVDYIHCNTPIGGVVGRLAGKKCKVKKIIYQVHGFHFYKGAPAKNWIIFYTAEKLLARYTDTIITINREDYEAAQKFKLRNQGKVYYVPGVGIDKSKYQTDLQIRKEKREELQLSEDDVVVISMGDLIERKNYPILIEAVAKVKNEKIQYFICGEGPEKEKLYKQCMDLGIEKQVHFLGYRTDIKELLQVADIFALSSYQEGLSRSLMEAMASGLPCISSRIRGNIDLLLDSNGGYLCDTLEDYVRAIEKLMNDEDIRKRMGLSNLKTIEKYSVGAVANNLNEIYKSELILPGGGVNLLDFMPIWARKRIEIGIPLDAILLISTGELNANKNNKVIIDALRKLNRQNIHYILCGVGEKEGELKKQAERAGLEENILFLGYRKDIKELLNASDIFIMASYREGLSRSIMEAMACGLPCIVSNIRGNADLILEGKGGFFCKTDDVNGFAEAINRLTKNSELRKKMANYNLTCIREFDVPIVENHIKNIYTETLA